MPHGFRVPEQRAERSRGPYATDGVGTTGDSAIALSTHTVDSMSMETALMLMDSSTSFAQSKDNFIVGITFLLGVVVMVHTFSLSSVPLFLISHTPSLAVEFAPQSSNDTVVGLGGVGRWLMVGGRDSWVSLAKLLSAVCTSFVTRSLVPSTSPTPFLASVWVLAGGIRFVCDVVVVVVELGGHASMVVKCG